MDITKIAVVGAGEMGHGIAEVFSLSGYNVNLIDISQDVLTKALSGIADSLDKLVKKGLVTQDAAEQTKKRIKAFTDMPAGVKDAELVMEAVPEVPDLKRKIFKQLGESTKPDTILGSNTSNIRITEIAEGVKNPERVVGIHFFNPPVILKLVEIIKGEKTSNETVSSIYALMQKIGRAPIRVNKDTPGFIVNRINGPDMLFFGLLFDKKLAKPEEVDAFMKLQGLPMGPYELLDFIGIDVINSSLLYFAKELSPDFSKVKVYADLVNKKMLGKKTGRGFYDWSAGRPSIIDSAKPTDKFSLMDIFSLEINEAVKLIEAGVATPEDIDNSVKLGMNRPFGPISVAKGLTNDEVKRTLERLAKTFDCQVFAPAESIKQGKMRDAVEGRLQITKDPNGTVSSNQTKYKYIILEKTKEKVTTISLNRPKLNLINNDVLDELDLAATELWDDDETRVILVSGRGGVFSAGADLSAYFANEGEFIEFSKKGQTTLNKFSEIPKITIAVLDGYVLGGGFELALACDIRVATSESSIGAPEVLRGLIPAWGGSQRLPKLMGVSNASRLILTGERITGKEAFEFGLVSKLFDADITSAAMAYAKDIAANTAPVAASLAKALINKGAEQPLEVGFNMESLAAGVVFNTEDLKEGLISFMQKRTPEFKGK